MASPGSPGQGPGTAYFAGGIPNPGYNGTSGSLGTMTFRTKATGSASLVVNSGSVLLNDGSGTNALSGTAGAKLTISQAVAAAGSITVTSATHPDQTKWYRSADVNLSWDRPANVYGYSFELDQNPGTVPDNTLDTTTTTSKIYSGLKDGVWYFHIKGRPQAISSAFGATTNFKIQIDTVAPESFTISQVSQALNFQTADFTSGVDHYELAVDGKLVDANAQSPYPIDKFGPGRHQVKVTALDPAGNSTSAELGVSITGSKVSFFQRNVSVPVYLLLILSLLVLILIVLNLWILFGRRPKRVQTRESATLINLEKEVDQTLSKLNKTKRKIENKINNTSRKR